MDMKSIRNDTWLKSVFVFSCMWKSYKRELWRLYWSCRIYFFTSPSKSIYFRSWEPRFLSFHVWQMQAYYMQSRWDKGQGTGWSMGWELEGGDPSVALVLCRRPISLYRSKSSHWESIHLFSCNLPPTLLAEWPPDSLCATAVMQGEIRYWDRSQHKKLTRGKNILPPLLTSIQPVTFRSRVWRSAAELSPCLRSQLSELKSLRNVHHLSDDDFISSHGRNLFLMCVF